MTTVVLSDLLGRDSELATIADTIRAAGGGEGRLLVIEGPAGIGKTALVAEARQAARSRGLRVLGARGSELEQDFAFGVVRQLFEPALATAESLEREAWLTGAAALAAPLFDPSGAAFTIGDQGFQRRHGLYWLAANMSGDGGLAILVDDIHWADAASVEFLGFLARRLEELPIALVVAGRPRQDAFLGLAVDPIAQVLRPDPLSGAEVVRLVGSVLPETPDQSFCEACRTATGGVPFLLRELLREIAAERIAPVAAHAERVAALSPRNVTSAVALRLARKPQSALALAQASAVLGDGAPLATAAELAGVSADEAPQSAQLLVEADVLAAEESLRFVHPIVRAAIYEGMPAAERPRAHARAASLLHARGAPDEAIAAQLRLAEPTGQPWAAGVLQAAAARAMSFGAPAVAAGHLRAALAEVGESDDRLAVLIELAEAESNAGDERAVERLAQAAALAESPVQRAEIAVERARLLRFLGRGPETLEVIEAAEAELGERDSDLRERLELERLGAATMSTSVLRRLAPLSDRLPDSGGTPENDYARFRLGLLALDQAQCGTSAERVVEVAHRAVAARPSSLPPTQVSSQATAMAAIALSLADHYEEALSLTDGLVELTERLGVIAAAVSLIAQRAQIHHRRGALREAEADAVHALQLGSEVRAAAALHTRAGGILTFVAVEQGVEPDPELMAAATATESTATRSLSYGRAEHLLARGHLSAALVELLAIGEFERQLGWEGPAQYPWRSQAALALDQLGDGDRARALAAEELELARIYGAPRPIGIALRATARFAPRARRIGLLEEAVEVLACSGAELEHARGLVELGTGLRISGRRAAAREHLMRGYELANQCGSTRLADHAWQELLAAGARPRRKELQGVASLTPSEHRIAELAAGGATNREIAQTLFVTAKTVETHLGHAYTKLGISSRVELEAALR